VQRDETGAVTKDEIYNSDADAQQQTSGYKSALTQQDNSFQPDVEGEAADCERYEQSPTRNKSEIFHILLSANYDLRFASLLGATKMPIRETSVCGSKKKVASKRCPLKWWRSSYGPASSMCGLATIKIVYCGWARKHILRWSELSSRWWR